MGHGRVWSSSSTGDQTCEGPRVGNADCMALSCVELVVDANRYGHGRCWALVTDLAERVGVILVNHEGVVRMIYLQPKVRGQAQAAVLVARAKSESDHILTHDGVLSRRGSQLMDSCNVRLKTFGVIDPEELSEGTAEARGAELLHEVREWEALV